MTGHGLDSFSSGQGPMVDCGECNSEPLHSRKCWEFC